MVDKLRSLLQDSWWEYVHRNCDSNGGEDAKCIVIPPSGSCRRASVLLFLLGDGHIGGKQDLLADAVGYLLHDSARLSSCLHGDANPKTCSFQVWKTTMKVIRSCCYIVVPEPTYESGLVCWRRKPEWDGPVAGLALERFQRGADLLLLSHACLKVLFAQHCAASPVRGSLGSLFGGVEEIGGRQRQFCYLVKETAKHFIVRVRADE